MIGNSRARAAGRLGGPEHAAEGRRAARADGPGRDPQGLTSAVPRAVGR